MNKKSIIDRQKAQEEIKRRQGQLEQQRKPINDLSDFQRILDEFGFVDLPQANPCVIEKIEWEYEVNEGASKARITATSSSQTRQFIIPYRVDGMGIKWFSLDGLAAEILKLL